MVLSMDRWKGKVAVVTGASSGIGAAICEKLVDAGLKVAGLARRIERVEAHSQNLKGKPGYLLPVKCDMTLEQDILNALKRTVEELGSISILVNNAGIYLHGNLTSISTEGFCKMWTTNVLGLTIATREATQNMMKAEIDGHIVHISSITGHATFHTGSAPYSSTKHAITALTNGLRLDLNAIGSKIKVTCISPGVVDTDMFGVNCTNKINETPKLKAEDVADSVIYALSSPPHVQVFDIIIKPIGECW